MTIDTARRRLLQAGTAAAGLGALPGMNVIRAAHGAGSPVTLVAIHLTGGNDTVNTVIPYANPEYYRIRKTLAIPKTASLRLDDRNALHPSLKGLKSLWDRKRLAIVHGVGYPQFDYSHFQAMQIYWTADPTRRQLTGWLGRTADTVIGGAAAPDALTATAVGSGVPLSLLSQGFTAPQLPSRARDFYLPARNDRQRTALQQVLAQPPTTTNYLYDGFLRNSRSALAAYQTVRAADAVLPTVTYPDEHFASSLKFAAQLIRADSAVRVITLEQGGYDHHEDLIRNHPLSLAPLDAGLKAFTDDLDRSGIANRVLILVWSEFARRVVPNDQNGVDHGTAQAMFLIGPAVRPGIVGTPPALTEASLVDDGNLPMQHDFRHLYATLLSGWMGLPARSVLGADFPTLPVLL